MKPKKILRILLWFALPILLIFSCLQVYLVFYLDNKVKELLQAEVQEQTAGEYRLEIGKLSLNIFDRSVRISSLRFTPLKLREARHSKYSITAGKIALLNFKLLPFLLKKDLIVERMELRDPSLGVYRNNTPASSPSKEQAEEFSLYRLLSGKVHSLEIGSIRISNADIRVYDDVKDARPSISSRNNELFISGMKVNEQCEASGSLFQADKVALDIRKFSYTTADSMYTIEVGKLAASYTDSLLRLDSIKLIPNYNKRAFTVEAGKQTDRVKLSIRQAQFRQMDVKLFFEMNWFLAGELEIEELDLSVFRDKNYRRKKGRVKSVQQILRSIPVHADIISIKLKKSKILYEEKEVGASKAGRVFFREVQAHIKGFSNDTVYFSGTHKLELQASGLFMDKGRLQLHYSFPLNTRDMVFDCSGKIRSMPLAAVNPMLEPNAHVSIREGMLDSMVFAFYGGQKGAKGTMKFGYHGLKVLLLNKKKEETRNWERILSMLAHQFYIKENNPSKGEALRITAIDYPRDPERFLFNYSWKALLSGIKPAIAGGKAGKKHKKSG